MDEISPITAAALATEGHVYCAGTLAQCVYRFNRLPEDKKADAFIKMGRDGETATIVRGAALQDLVTGVLDKIARARSDRDIGRYS
jgi:hypothetical protein